MLTATPHMHLDETLPRIPLDSSKLKTHATPRYARSVEHDAQQSARESACIRAITCLISKLISTAHSSKPPTQFAATISWQIAVQSQ